MNLHSSNSLLSATLVFFPTLLSLSPSTHLRSIPFQLLWTVLIVALVLQVTSGTGTPIIMQGGLNVACVVTLHAVFFYKAVKSRKAGHSCKCSSG